MSRLVGIVLLAVSLAAIAGCTLGASSLKAAHLQPIVIASPPVGDRCLAGTWILQLSTNASGYTFNNVPLRVTGLRGATLTVQLNGSSIEDFANSAPLIGTTADGGQLAITVRGTWTFTIRGSGHNYDETGATTALPTTATFKGKPATYHSSHEPSSGTYECTATSLTMTTDSGVQTDTWSKG